VPVCDDDGVPVWVWLGVPVCEAEGVPVWLWLGVPVCDDELVLVAEGDDDFVAVPLTVDDCELVADTLEVGDSETDALRVAVRAAVALVVEAAVWLGLGVLVWLYDGAAARIRRVVEGWAAGTRQ
jgi:hypothetical protein